MLDLGPEEYPVIAALYASITRFGDGSAGRRNLFRRQPYSHAPAASLAILQLDLAAIRFGDRADDREAEAGAAGRPVA